jgi:C4-dicarboxylate-binding protein DctP
MKARNTQDNNEGGTSMRPALVIAGLILAMSFAPARADEPIIIKFSHVVAPDTPKGKAAEKFKALAEERTHGRVRVEVYPNSQLYKDKEELEALQLGAVQMLAPSLSKFGPLGIREFEAFDLPYIFPSTEALRRVTDGPIGKQLFAKLELKGILGLAYWDNGFSIITSNKPLRTLEDFKGMKMRIQSSKVLEATYRHLGALPQVMAFSEVYQALQTGVVDGVENTPSNSYTQKFYEVQKYLTVSYHTYIGYAVVVNKKFWEGLPADIRTALESAMKDATIYCNDIAEKENQEALAKIKASGNLEFIVLSDQEKAVWRKGLMPVHEEMSSRIGKDLIQSIYKETGAGATQ